MSIFDMDKLKNKPQPSLEETQAELAKLAEQEEQQHQEAVSAQLDEKQDRLHQIITSVAAQLPASKLERTLYMEGLKLDAVDDQIQLSKGDTPLYHAPVQTPDLQVIDQAITELKKLNTDSSQQLLRDIQAQVHEELSSVTL